MALMGAFLHEAGATPYAQVNIFNKKFPIGNLAQKFPDAIYTQIFPRRGISARKIPAKTVTFRCAIYLIVLHGLNLCAFIVHLQNNP